MTGPSRWTAFRPVKGRAVWARHPAHAHHHPHRPLAARLDEGGRRLADHRGVGPQQLGPVPPQGGQPALLSGQLLAGVEAPGDVDRRLLDRAGQVEHDRQAAFHVGGTHPPQHVALEARPTVGARGHRVEVAGHHQPLGSPSSVRATTLSPSRDHLQPRAGAEVGRHPVGQGRLVAADRRRGHQLGGEGRGASPTAAQAETPCSRSTVVQLGLVVALALVEPLDHQHAGEEELAAGVLPPAGGRDRHRPGRHHPREISTPVSASMTGMAGLRMVPSPSTAPCPPGPPR